MCACDESTYSHTKSWGDAALSVYHLHTYHTHLQYQHGEYVFTQVGQQKTDHTPSLFPPPIEQQTPYAITQLGSSTCSTNIMMRDTTRCKMFVCFNAIFGAWRGAYGIEKPACALLYSQTHSRDQDCTCADHHDSLESHPRPEPIVQSSQE
jgi:hypothetical protein